MKFRFTLTGVSPLLMHADDVEKADQLDAFRKDSKNRDSQKKGDDRSPPWSWHTYVYSDGKNIVVPSDNISAALLQAGAQIILNKSKTFKELSQAGLFIHDDFLPVLVDGKPIKVSDIDKLRDKPFTDQAEAVKDLGFVLFVKRATVGASKHVRVRPRFDNWSLSSIVEVTAKEITEDKLREMFQIAGFYKGLCDWRPGSPKRPGRFGRWETKIEAVK